MVRGGIDFWTGGIVLLFQCSVIQNEWVSVMRHRCAGRKLGRNASHRKAMFRNMAVSLIRTLRTEEGAVGAPRVAGRIVTTVAKAKELRPFVERLVTYAKRNTLASRRLAMARLQDAEAVSKLFDAIGPRYGSRAGGYTRVVKRAKRGANDGRKLAYIAFV